MFFSSGRQEASSATPPSPKKNPVASMPRRPSPSKCLYESTSSHLSAATGGWPDKLLGTKLKFCITLSLSLPICLRHPMPTSGNLAPRAAPCFAIDLLSGIVFHLSCSYCVFSLLFQQYFCAIHLFLNMMLHSIFSIKRKERPLNFHELKVTHLWTAREVHSHSNE